MSSEGDSRPSRTLARKLALAGASFALTLLVLEVLVRLLLPPTRYHDSPLEYDPELGFRGVPNFSQTVRGPSGSHDFSLDADGLRGRSLPSAPAEPGVRRIAFLGDSFLVGVYTPEAALMTARLESELRARGRQDEVYNLSIIDSGTAQQILLLDRYAARIDPDVVVLVLYTGNDIVNNSPLLAGTTRVSPGDPIRAYLVPEEGGLRHVWGDPVRGHLRRLSRLFTTLERQLLSSMEWTLPPARPVRERLKYGLAPREHLEFLRRHDPIDRWEQAWRTTFELLRALNERVLALNARLLVLVVPSMHQVEHGPHAVRYGAEALAFAGRPLGRIVDWNLPERRLTTFLGRADIPVRVLVTELREAARSGPVYTQDQHLNERGHEVAAEVVLRWLEGEEPDRSSPIAGAPVNVLGEFRETSRLDFRREAHYAALGDGWLSWHPEGEEGGAGWIIGPSALVVLPARTGDLVVRGVVPKAALLPVEGKVVMVGGPRKNFALSEHGPFELRVPWRAGAGGVDSTGHAAVMIIPGTTHVEKGFPVGFRVLEVAFE